MPFNVTVPGVPDAATVYSTITLGFQSAANQSIALSLLSAVYAAAAGQTLQVADDSVATVSGANPTTLSEYVLGDAFGIQNSGTTDGTVPAGFKFIVDAWDQTHQASTIFGATGQTGETVIAGNNMTFHTSDGSGTVLAGLGGGNLIVGDTGDTGWTILFDGGNNTVDAGAGGYLIDDGNRNAIGVNLIFLNASGTDTVESWGNDSIIAAPGGSALVVTFNSRSTFWGNTGTSTYINLGGADSFFAGGGSDTVFAGASGGTYFGNTGPLLFISGPGTSDSVVTGAGNATLFGAAGSSGLYFLGAGHDIVSAGAEALTVVGGTGSGSAQIFGSDGSDITFFGQVSGNVLVAGPGNVTLDGGGSTGNDVFFAGPGKSSNDSIVAGSGNNTLTAGPGHNTLVGGSGADVFQVDKAFAGGGADSIFGWTSKDLVSLFGYGAPTAPGGLPADAKVSVVGGSEVLTLADGTKITFVGFASIPNSHIQSS